MSQPADTSSRRIARLAARVIKAGSGALADALMPPACVACRQTMAGHDSLCAACWRDVRFIQPPLCDRLGIPMPYDTGGTMISAAAAAHPPAYDRARAVAAYDGVVRKLIHGFKYNDHHEARKLFARWLLRAGAELFEGADYIAPVPLNRMRLLSRRINQSAILAQDVARQAGVRFCPTLLQRRRRTPPQVGLTSEERRRNVAGAFVVDGSQGMLLTGKVVVLVDDVITTGATVEACARALRSAGADRIDVLALARVVDTAA